MRGVADFQSPFRRQTAPVTIALLCGLVGFAVLLFLVRISVLPLVVTEGWTAKPWALVTYPFFVNLGVGGTGVIGLLFLSFWLYWIGSDLESDVGSLRLGLFWLAGSVIPALFVVLGATLLGKPQLGYAGGAMLPISTLTVIWGVRNKTAAIRLMLILPITGLWLAWLTVAIVFVDYGITNLLIGAFAAAPLGLAWLYAEGKIPGVPYGRKQVTVAYKPTKEARAREQAYFEEVRRREQDREERERLRKLFEDGSKDE